MKPVNQMSLDEIRYLVHVHEFPNEDIRRQMYNEISNMQSIMEMVCQRIKLSLVPGKCDCHYCETAPARQPRTPKPEKKKAPPITFSLDT